MKKIVLLTGLILVSILGHAQQDPQYNLYQYNQMVINPAYAGARDGLAAIASVRKQWAGFSGAPQTTCFSIHSPVLKKNIGVGLTLVNDVMGPRNVISAYGNFAYIIKLNNRYKLSFGLNAGYNRYQFNFGQINFKEGEVPSQLLQNQNAGALDVNSGLYLRNTSFYMGISATHLNAPNVYSYAPVTPGSGNFTYHLNPHLFVTVGKSFIIDNNVIFAPTALIKIVNSTYGADLNLNFFLYKQLWLGVFYRNGYGPGALMQYYVTSKLRVAYSYDTGLSDARRLGSSHEFMLGFDFSGKTSTKAKMINPRFL